MRSLLLVGFLGVSAAAQAASWSDLWLTHDQQAQRLLEAGKPADAAREFQDARRRAYAEIKAGRYEDAAERLQSFEDPQSQYNRGNALARSGQLESALAAYDGAIEQTPADSALGRDARHNRELVAKQLEKQRSSQSKGGRSESGKKDQPQSGKQNGQESANGSQQQPGDGSQGEQSQGEQARDEQSGQDPAGQDQSGQDQASAQKKPQGAQGESASAQAEKRKQEADDARRDAEAAMARAKQDNARPDGPTEQSAETSKDGSGKPAAGEIEQPPSEQSLALDQWLRQIPDDPSGLLRRKFLIEHLKRQQESRQ